MRGRGFVLEVVRVALDAIRSNKLRSVLTMLGIVIGIAAVITMVALGQGAQQAVQQQIASLGTDVLTVRPGSGWFRRGGGDRARLTMEDVEIVRRAATAVEGISPEMDQSFQVEYGRANGNFRVVGTSPSYPDVSHSDVAMGRFFNEEEDRGRRRVAVLGSAIPEALDVQPIELLGQTILIRNVRFEVMGIMEERGSQGPGPSQDDQVFVPVNTARFRLMGTERIGSFDAQVQSEPVGYPVAGTQTEAEPLGITGTVEGHAVTARAGVQEEAGGFVCVLCRRWRRNVRLTEGHGWDRENHQDQEVQAAAEDCVHVQVSLGERCKPVGKAPSGNGFDIELGTAFPSAKGLMCIAPAQVMARR